MSTVLLVFAFAVNLAALFNGSTAMSAEVPKVVSVIAFFLLMCLTGLLDGMQIALFAVVKLPEETLKHHKIAAANCQLAFRGHNFQAFLIGRQIMVTLCMFIIARITTIEVETGKQGEGNIFGVGDSAQEFFNSGLLGALITTIFASLAWRIIASSFPLAFMSNPFLFAIIHTCLILEKSGLCSVAWLLAWIHKKIARFQIDEVYLETMKTQKEEEISNAGSFLDH